MYNKFFYLYNIPKYIKISDTLSQVLIIESKSVSHTFFSQNIFKLYSLYPSCSSFCIYFLPCHIIGLVLLYISKGATVYRQATNTNPEPKGVPKIQLMGIPLSLLLIEKKINTYIQCSIFNTYPQIRSRKMVLSV